MARRPFPPWRREDPPGTTWRRRLVTVPTFLVGVAVVWLGAPCWLLAALVWDLTRGRALGASRTVLVALLFTLLNTLGIAASAAAAPFAPMGSARSERVNRWILRTWAWLLFRVGFRLFDVRLHVEGQELARQGPYVIFLRHAAIADTLFGPLLFERPFGIRLRYVIKQELHQDPAFDIIGHRLPVCFVDRRPPDPEAEIARVASLGRHLGPDEGVYVYPEGTRFTEAKRQWRIDHAQDDATRDRIASYQAVLPPKHGGPLAVLDAAGPVDVVTVAHVGLETVVTFADLLQGRIVDTDVYVRLRRVPAAAIPQGHAARCAWLDRLWHRMDDDVQALSRTRHTAG